MQTGSGSPMGGTQLRATTSDLDSLFAVQTLPAFNKLLTHIQAGCKRRVFFTTETEFIGLGPVTELESGSKGDRICIVYGANTLSVIREVEGEGQRDCFDLVGEVYMNGLMDGEAAEIREERDIVLR